MAAIARDFNSIIIKHTCDSLIYYFPETSDAANMSAFKGVLECGFYDCSTSHHKHKTKRGRITIHSLELVKIMEEQM
jgi:hypothetical protein